MAMEWYGSKYRWTVVDPEMDGLIITYNYRKSRELSSGQNVVPFDPSWEWDSLFMDCDIPKKWCNLRTNHQPTGVSRRQAMLSQWP